MAAVQHSSDCRQPTLGNHADLLRRLSWAFYSLWKYFSIYGNDGTNELPSAKTFWDDLVIVTLSKFGLTTVENAIIGTSAAEASVMLVAGGAVKGLCKPANTTGCVCSDGVTVAGEPNFI